MDRYRISYAQNREDILLKGFFKDIKKGFYVDVGANHPDTLSTTKNFYDTGWRGINIEPNPHLYKLLKQQRPRDINLNFGAADKTDQLKFREYPEGDGLSTFSAESQKNYEQATSEYRPYTAKHKDRTVKVFPLKQILADNPLPAVHFMNIDVEGFEYEVISGNDWKKFRPWVLCIEANHLLKDWRPLLKKAKYDHVFSDGLNNYYVASEHKEIGDNFSYVNTVLLDKPIVPAAFHIELVASKGRTSQLNNDIARQGLLIEELRQEIQRLNRHIINNSRLRSLIKQIAVKLNKIVLLNIEKLNKPKVKNQRPISIEQGMSLSAMLHVTESYDMQRYYNFGSAEPAIYRIVKSTYIASYKLAVKLSRSLMRKLRRG